MTAWARLVIDWHNLGYTILALRLGRGHFTVRLARWLEKMCGRAADAHLCVSRGFSRFLAERFHLSDKHSAPVRVLYDRPASVFVPLSRVEVRDPVTREPPKPSAAVRDPTRGLPEVEVDGVVFRRGCHVVVKPGIDADLQARRVEGRTVRIERIQRDYDGRVHLGVSVDEPGHEIMRETGRFLWFFPPEVEVLE